MRHRSPGTLPQRVVKVHERTQSYTPRGEGFGAEDELQFTFSERGNLFSTLRRLRAVIDLGAGAVVSNGWLELSLFDVFPPVQTVFQVVHDEYNFGLAKTYEPVVDVMIAHSRYYHDKLLQEFPARGGQIHYAPYGIHLAPVMRSPRDGPLRLVFLGRLHRDKGVYDLPRIDKLLREAGVELCWSVIGDGPERLALQQAWPENSRVHYSRPATNEGVLQLCAEGDVFVFPTRFEGFPVALLEAMSTGLVPVVSDLPSGIPEVVVAGVGFRVPVGDSEGFASAILQLVNDRDGLESMSKAARKQAERFDIRDRASAYHELFARWAEFKRPRPKSTGIYRGSRLDQPWLPNSLVYALRTLRNRVLPWQR
ncbi:MAG: glycosyltransferase [Bryobacteraceae bacterium]